MISALLCAALVSTPAVARDKANYRLSKDERRALESIAERSMQANLTFLASDLLEGRATPSRGLDIAAEYIAAHFQRAGLEPAGSDGYFQVADWVPRRGSGAGGAESVDPGTEPPKVRNVVGLLRGSDPKLADTYLLITAHYDHLGMASEGLDRIFNGANDDASGVVAVMELANALASLPKRPRRSIVFIAFYGEERGLVGSRYYADHPLAPLSKTVVNINLEQLGRTDDADNPGPGGATVTGMDYSNVGTIVVATGKQQGIRMYKHERYSDSFFTRSDNLPFARRGVPAHTIASSFVFPDGHKVGDHADKIDYRNLAQITRAIGHAVLAIANNPKPPQWNPAEPKAAPYLEAWKTLQAAAADRK